MKVKRIIETVKKILADGILVNFDSSNESDLKGNLYFSKGEFYKTAINVTKVKINLNFEVSNIINSSNDPEILIDKINEILLNKFYVDEKPLYISEIGISTVDTGLVSSISIEYEKEKAEIDTNEIISEVNFNNKQEG